MAATLEKHQPGISPHALRLLNDARAWLQDDSIPFATRFGYITGVRSEILSTRYPALSSEEDGPIIIIQQFYIAPNAVRHAENIACLKRNIANPEVNKIVLLNEREYTPKELGIAELSELSKLEQVVIGKRLTYLDAFAHARQLENAFVVLANADIFTDESIRNIKRMGLAAEKRVLCQLRHEYAKGRRLEDCVPFGSATGFPRQCNSQDAWIWHSSHSIPACLEGAFAMQLGKPGCDNAVAHRFSMAGFERCNCPSLARTYHYHTSELRSYQKDPAAKCSPPYQLLIPSYSPNDGGSSRRTKSLDRLWGNKNLASTIQSCLKSGTPFYIPRVAGIENDVAALGAELQQSGRLDPSRRAALNRGVEVIRKHAGVHLEDTASIIDYSRAYLEAIKHAPTFFTWAPWSNVTRFYGMSFTFVETNFRQPTYDAGCLDVFDALWAHPWTWALRGQRVLIVSPFIDTIKQQSRKKGVYPIDLFPECEFVFLRPPQTQGESPGRPFSVELAHLASRVEAIKDDFDVALCSCGGYGNPLCHAIHKLGKSAIYVGGVLQMYFGVLGRRWERERPEVVAAYKNSTWTRPQEHERPAGHEKIEDSCYW